MPRWTIWYWRPEVGQEALSGQLEADMTHLHRTHIELGDVEAKSKEDVFAVLNVDNWDNRDVIKSRGLSHTSMSVGDVIVSQEGATWMVAPLGWTQVGVGD